MLSETDITWLKSNYPDLCYYPRRNSICGELAFRMLYSPIHPNIYTINPNVSINTTGGVLIEDVYEIEIRFENIDSLPIVRELGGRIKRCKEKWNIQNIIDLHVYPDGNLCLCPPTEADLKLPDGFSLQTFCEVLLIPFFYYQSYFERHGQEPWKSYSHGDLGILESFNNRICKDQISQVVVDRYIKQLSSSTRKIVYSKRKVKGHNKCLCGSGKRFRNCHLEAFRGCYNLQTLC